MRTTRPQLRRTAPEIIALALLVPLGIVLGIVLTRWPTDPPAGSPPHTPPTSVEASPLSTVSPSPTAPPTVAPAATAVPRAPTASLSIESPTGTRTYLLPAAAETTVADLLLRASAEEGLALETKDYGPPLGLFIESLNGVRNDPARQRYWHLFINDALSPLGASSARVSPGDTVTWRYEPPHEEE